MKTATRRYYALWLTRMTLAAIVGLVAAVLYLCYLVGACETTSISPSPAGLLAMVSQALATDGDPAAEPTPSPLATLLAEIVPDDGPARPPCQLARYDLGLEPAGKDSRRDLDDLREQAVARQDGLWRLWTKTVNEAAAGPAAASKSDLALLAYAFGETGLEEAISAAAEAGPAERFRLARLLLAECRFDNALRLLAAVADEPPKDAADVLPRRALALVVRHDAERTVLAKHLPLVPLGFDLRGYLDRRAKDPATRSFIEAVRQTSTIRLPAQFRDGESVEVFEIGESEEVLPTEFDVDPTLEQRYVPANRPHSFPAADQRLYDLNRLYLSTGSPELVLYQGGSEWNSGERARLTLHSELNGPIRFRLYRFTQRAAWQAAGATGLAKLRPERTWSQTSGPLKDNNLTGAQDWSVDIEGLAEGYYLLTAEARYAPMLAACKFCVSNVAVYLRAGRNEAVAVAVDRRNSTPMANLPLRLHITGRPDLKILSAQIKPAVEDAFLRGFRGDGADVQYDSGPEVKQDRKRRKPRGTGGFEADDPPNPDDDPFGDALSAGEHSDDETNDDTTMGLPAPEGDSPAGPREHVLPQALLEAQSYAHGVEPRRRYPDFEQVRDLRTGADGRATAAVDLGRREYQYKLEVERVAQGLDAGPLSNVSLDYQEPAPGRQQTRTIVWLSQPVHRPGEKVRFAGIVRQFDGVHLRTPRGAGVPSAPQTQVTVRVENSYGCVWQGPCQLSPAGMFHGEFRIPPTTRTGTCGFFIDNTRASPSPSLTVDEFRLSTYDVVLSVPRRSYAGGERIEGKAMVTYLTGKSAAGAEVEVVLETGRKDHPTVIGKTDSQGVFRFCLPVPVLNEDASCLLRATVSDVSGQSYTCCEQIVCKADAFQLVATPSEDAGHAGTTVQLQIQATNWAGEPLAGATVVASGASQTATTDRNGKATLAWKIGRGQNWITSVTAVSGGKAVHRQCEVRVLDEFTGIEERPPAPAIASWQAPQRADAGQPVTCTLKLAGPKGRALTLVLFAENNRLLSSRVLRLSPGEHRITIPTKVDWAPSAEFVAVLLDGCRSNARTARCYLHPAEKFLKLEVRTDKAEYRPGDRCTVVVAATDHQGKPAPRAEISLGVVDEAVYQVREDPLPDLFRMLYEYRVDSMCRECFDGPTLDAESFQWLLGPRWAWGFFLPELTKDGELKGAGYGYGRRGSLACYGGTAHTERGCRLTVRRRFETAAHWVANLVTDAEGKARTTFAFPDNITAWRFTARGVTPDTLVGDVRLTRRTLLPLAVEPMLPRGLRAGDHIDLPVVVHNHTDAARTVHGTTRTRQEREEPWTPRPLAAKGNLQFTVPVKATDRQPLEVFASVHDSHGTDADAARKQIVPLPRGRLVTRAFSGPLEKETVVRVDFPQHGGPGRDGPEAITLVVCREPGLAGPVQSALDELIQYPYGCVEQTMSRFMPAVVAGEALKKARLRNPSEERLHEVIAQGLAKLAGYQHADGGWGWWQHDDTNDFMTAYVLEGLARCRRLGQPVDSSMIEQASRHLLRVLRARQLQGHRPQSIGEVDLNVYAAHALAILLSQHQETHAQDLAELRAAVARIDQVSKRLALLDRILLTDTWRLLGDGAPAAANLEQLAAQALPKRGDRRSIFAAAAMVELGAALEPKDSRWPLLGRKLVAVRTGSDWGDTLTTSAAVRGLAAVLAAPQAKEVPVTVKVDGRQVGILTAANGNRIELKLARVGTVMLDADVGQVSNLSHANAAGTPARRRLGGTPAPQGDSYTVRVEGYSDAPPANPPAPVVTLRTRVFRLQPKREEVKPDASGRLTIARGVTHEVQLEAELEQAVSHARLTLPRPCGVELVRAPKRDNGVVAFEARDDALHFFVDRWEPGKHQVVLPVRAEVSGTVSSPPPELAPMYGDSLPTALFGPAGWTIQEDRASRSP